MDYINREEAMNETCTDNRFEVIAAYKKKLKERTNIETSPDEMAVIDHVLFRFWQMGWLPPVPHGRLIDADALTRAQGLHDYKYENGLVYVRVCEVVSLINAAPTVIPAEEGE